MDRNPGMFAMTRGDLKRSRREPRAPTAGLPRPQRRRRQQMRQWRDALIVCAAIAAALMLAGRFAGPERQPAPGRAAEATTAPLP